MSVTTKKTPFFRRDDIRIYKKAAGGEPEEVLTGVQTLLMDQPGIYTLEGHNQSGKSVLIKFLMGALPRGFDQTTQKEATILEGKRLSISSVAHAHKLGMYAVFQDDELIPTMTIGEQFQMCHAVPKVVDYFVEIVHLFLHFVYAHQFARIFPKIQKLTKLSWWKKIEHHVLPQIEVDRNAEKILAELGFPGILGRYPGELSGGAKAAARLTAALLSPRLKLLFLDEPFAAVDAHSWPRMLDRVKAWVTDKNAAVLVVSHNPHEITRWSPRKRFKIETFRLVEEDRSARAGEYAVIPEWRASIPFYFSPFEELPQGILGSSTESVILVDKGVAESLMCKESLAAIKQKLAHRTGRQPDVVMVPTSGEKEKSMEVYGHLMAELGLRIQDIDATIVIVGGGSHLNLAGLVAGTYLRGRCNIVYVPTTITAIADVAVGSKTAVNLVLGERGSAIYLKNAVGTYTNPSAVLIDKAFLAALYPEELSRGMVECLKHSILQDAEMYRGVLAAIRAPTVDTCLEYALRAAEMKSSLLSMHPLEDGDGRILKYGHFHAHSIEKASAFEIPHSSAVYFGILVDLKLGGDESIYSDVVNIVGELGGIGGRQWLRVSEAALQAAYKTDFYFDLQRFEVIKIKEVGEYGHPIRFGLNMKAVGEDHIFETVSMVLKEVEAALNKSTPRSSRGG